MKSFFYSSLFLGGFFYSKMAQADIFSDVVNGVSDVVSGAVEQKQTSSVHIYNMSSYQLLTVNVRHMYSDEYQDSMRFVGPISNGYYMDHRQVEKGQSNVVHYYTGVTTTGLDWWKVEWAWQYNGTGQVCKTNPNNFREVFDTFDNTVVELNTLVGNAASKFDIPGTISTNVQNEFLSMAGVDTNSATASLIRYNMPAQSWVPSQAGMAILAMDVATKTWVNNTKTSGFKQHMLEAQDARDGGVKIEIYDNGVRFVSPSGVSETVYTCQTVQAPKVTLKNSNSNSNYELLGTNNVQFYTKNSNMCLSYMADYSIQTTKQCSHSSTFWSIQGWAPKGSPEKIFMKIINNPSLGVCMAFPDQSTGTALSMYNCDFQFALQNWVYEDNDEEYSQLINQSTGKCAAVYGGSTGEWARLVQEPCSNSEAQLFRVEMTQ